MNEAIFLNGKYDTTGFSKHATEDPGDFPGLDPEPEKPAGLAMGPISKVEKVFDPLVDIIQGDDEWSEFKNGIALADSG